MFVVGASCGTVTKCTGNADCTAPQTCDIATGVCKTPSCASTAECGTGKICHPTLKQCIASCTGSGDCPSSAKTCATFSGNADAGGDLFCQCSTDNLCNGGSSGTLICQDTTSKICTAKCAANTDCGSGGATCDTATGKCKPAGTGTDAGVDAGVDAGMSLDAGVACNKANQQPDVCRYGEACFDSNTCEDITDDTSCTNITGSNRAAFNPATSTGPVIFKVVSEAPNNSQCVAGQTAFTVTVYAYAAPGSTFPDNKSNLPGFFYYAPGGSPVTDIALNLLPPSGYTKSADKKVMTAKFSVCPTGTGLTSWTAGFGFTGGNGYCASLTR